jgi:branched-chain amino acid transport system ATP-binding protein
MGEVTEIFTPLKYLMAARRETLSGGEDADGGRLVPAWLRSDAVDEFAFGPGAKIVDDVLGVIRRLARRHRAIVVE